MLLPAQEERRLGIAGRLAAHIADRRDPARVRHSLPDILFARYLAIAAGYEGADDLDALRHGVRPLNWTDFCVCRLTGAGSFTRFFLAFDDDGAGPEDNHDDFIMRVDVTAVPLPAAAWLLLVSLAGLGFVGRRHPMAV